MKRALPVYLILCFAAAPAAHAAFYQWTDAEGVVHFTDNPKQIPAKERKKAKKMKLQEEPSGAQVGQGAQATPAPPAAQLQPLPPADRGGHSEAWWRGRFKAYKDQMLAIQDQIAQKQSKMVELRRKRAIYQRVRDREAINAMEAEIAADEARLAELQNGLAKFDLEATSAGVPPEWRR